MTDKQANSAQGANLDSSAIAGAARNLNMPVEDLIKLITLTVANATPREPAIIRYRSLLKPLDPEGEGRKGHGVRVGSWLQLAEQKLRDAEVPAKDWVVVAADKIPADKYTMYSDWCKEKGRDSTDWTAFSEFLLREYAGAMTEFDTYLQWRYLEPPHNVEQLDDFYHKFVDLVKLLGLGINEKTVVFEFANKLPPSLYQRLFADQTEGSKLTLETARAIASSYFRAEALSSNAMDTSAAVSVQATAVDNQAMHVYATRGNHQMNRRPPFEEVKNLCDNNYSLYNKRVTEGACVGCGEKSHFFVGCRLRHPKGRKD
ncbi:hypothetical protein H4S06_002628 [Coemansia sp. BCRC 34490]|nr:hypothetical protein H4S06_002628 [Coemansia sp. BCRC 34490]